MAQLQMIVEPLANWQETAPTIDAGVAGLCCCCCCNCNND